MFSVGTLLPTLPPNFVHMSVITCVSTHTFACMWSLEVSAFFFKVFIFHGTPRWARLASQTAPQILLSPPSQHWN